MKKIIRKWNKPQPYDRNPAVILIASTGKFSVSSAYGEESSYWRGRLNTYLFDKLIEFSTSETTLNVKHPIIVAAKGEFPNRLYLNPEAMVQYDDEEQLVKLRTLFVDNSQYKFTSKALFDDFVKGK